MVIPVAPLRGLSLVKPAAVLMIVRVCRLELLEACPEEAHVPDLVLFLLLLARGVFIPRAVPAFQEILED